MTQHAETIPEARPSRAAIALGYEMAMREAADVLSNVIADLGQNRNEVMFKLRLCTVADGFRRKAAEVAGTKR